MVSSPRYCAKRGGEGMSDIYSAQSDFDEMMKLINKYPIKPMDIRWGDESRWVMPEENEAME
jgi:hypothetical protein